MVARICRNPLGAWSSSDQGDDRAKKLEPTADQQETGLAKPRLGGMGLVVLAPQVLVTSATSAARRGVDILGTAHLPHARNADAYSSGGD